MIYFDLESCDCEPNCPAVRKPRKPHKPSARCVDTCDNVYTCLDEYATCRVGEIYERWLGIETAYTIEEARADVGFLLDEIRRLNGRP